MRGIGMSPRDFEASINGSKTNLMKPPPPQSGHLNRAFNLLAADLRAAGATSLRAIAAGPNERGIQPHAVAHGMRRRLCACWRVSSPHTTMPAMAFYDLLVRPDRWAAKP